MYIPESWFKWINGWTVSAAFIAFVFVVASIFSGSSQETEKQQLAAISTPTPSPELQNTCVDGETPADSLSHFNISKARISKKADGNILLSLDATFVSTSDGFASSPYPISILKAGGGWIDLTLENASGQEDFLIIIANNRVIRPDWESQDYIVSLSETKTGVDILFEGWGIQAKTEGDFKWAVATRDEGNRWDLCPEQEHSISLGKLIALRNS